MRDAAQGAKNISGDLFVPFRSLRPKNKIAEDIRKDLHPILFARRFQVMAILISPQNERVLH